MRRSRLDAARGASRLGSALAFLVLAACGAREPGSVAPADIPDPTTLARTGRPNDWLICPPGVCRAEAGSPAPAYPVPPERLLEAWRAVLEAEPRVTVVAEDPSRLLLLAQDRTPFFRFVDTVSIRVLPAAEGSTFAAYSRSEIGYGDLGTNRARLEAWMAALDRRPAPRS
jgi:uncharacterized protein (DUF1499 family)